MAQPVPKRHRKDARRGVAGRDGRLRDGPGLPGRPCGRRARPWRRRCRTRRPLPPSATRQVPLAAKAPSPGTPAGLVGRALASSSFRRRGGDDDETRVYRVADGKPRLRVPERHRVVEHAGIGFVNCSDQRAPVRPSCRSVTVAGTDAQDVGRLPPTASMSRKSSPSESGIGHAVPGRPAVGGAHHGSICAAAPGYGVTTALMPRSRSVVWLV